MPVNSKATVAALPTCGGDLLISDPL